MRRSDHQTIRSSGRPAQASAVVAQVVLHALDVADVLVALGLDVLDDMAVVGGVAGNCEG